MAPIVPDFVQMAVVQPGVDNASAILQLPRLVRRVDFEASHSAAGAFKNTRSMYECPYVIIMGVNQVLMDVFIVQLIKIDFLSIPSVDRPLCHSIKMISRKLILKWTSLSPSIDAQECRWNP